MTSDFQARRTAFGHRLRDLRQQGGFTGRQLAAALGPRWPQSKVSKVETGRQTATPDDLDDWFAVVDVPGELADRLREELHELRGQEIAWRQQLREGHRHRQVEIRELETRADQITGFSTACVPGLLQTPDYARAVFSTQAQLHAVHRDEDAAVQERLRRQEILHSNTPITILMTESALLHPVVTPQAMIAQLDRITTLTEFPNLDVGILPATHRLPLVPLHGFWLYELDGHGIAFVETITTELRIDDTDQFATYRRFSSELHQAAATGPQARTLLQQLISRYQAR